VNAIYTAVAVQPRLWSDGFINVYDNFSFLFKFKDRLCSIRFFGEAAALFLRSTRTTDSFIFGRPTKDKNSLKNKTFTMLHG